MCAVRYESGPVGGRAGNKTPATRLRAGRGFPRAPRSMCAVRYESGLVGRRDANKSASAGLREEGTKEVYNGEGESDAFRKTRRQNLESPEERSRAAEDALGTSGNRLKGNRCPLSASSSEAGG